MRITQPPDKLNKIPCINGKIGFLFLGREFAFNTGYATLLMSLELMVLEKVAPLFGPLSDQLQDFIHQQHLNAFISMLSTTEVFGKGFNHA